MHGGVRASVPRGRCSGRVDADSSLAGAAGGHALLTTTADLSRFLDGLLERRLFRHRRTLRQMRSFVAAPSPGGQVGYGLGLERYSFGGTERLDTSA